MQSSLLTLLNICYWFPGWRDFVEAGSKSLKHANSIQISGKQTIQWDDGSETELILMSDAHNLNCIDMSDIEPQMLIISIYCFDLSCT